MKYSSAILGYHWQSCRSCANIRDLWHFLAIIGNLWQSLVIFGNLWQALEIIETTETYQNYWKCIEIYGNQSKILEIYMGIGELKFGTDITRFPGLVFQCLNPICLV